MAEFVEEVRQRLLPEYEKMKLSGVCKMEHIRKTMEKRDGLLHKIIQNSKCVANYIEFIRYEKLVHKWIMEKEKTLGVNLDSIKYTIVNRIINLYQEAVKYFPDDERLWEHYILCAKKSLPDKVSIIYEKMLSFHGNKANVWCDAGIWAYAHTGNLDKVKEIFFRALLKHSKSEILNIAFIGILLKETAAMSSEKTAENKFSEKDIGLQMVTLVYRNSKSEITNVKYFIKLLNRCEEQPFNTLTLQLQKEIIDDLMGNFPRDESVWHCLAQRELKGYSMIDLKNINKLDIKIKSDLSKSENNQSEKMEEKYNPPSTEMTWKTRDFNKRLELCLHVYQVAVRTLVTPLMCSYFINAMLILNQDNEPNEYKTQCLLTAFQECHVLQLMNHKQYFACIKMILKYANSSEIAIKLLNEATHLEKNKRYYEMWMHAYIVDSKEDKLIEIIKEADEKLNPNDCACLWRLLINFMKSRDNCPHIVKYLNEAAVKIDPEFGDFRVEYLEYISCTENLKKTRQVYDELSLLPPPCLQLHQKMADIESKTISELKLDNRRWRKCYENAAFYFGKTHPEVWIDYIRFERDHGDIKNMSLLYDRGKSCLQSYLIETFLAKYTELMTNK